VPPVPVLARVLLLEVAEPLLAELVVVVQE
jgi:hypothetical protein